MQVWQAIILGMIQGLTEFLPVSSSGHLVLFETIFGLSENLFLTLFLHIGTLMAVIVVYRKTLLSLIKNPFSALAKKLYLASFITICLVLIFKGFIENSFGGNFYIFGFSISGFLLILTQILCSGNIAKNKELGFKNACLMGIAQGFACLPGVSRSGSTICMGLLSKGDRDKVADFSFLMSIPIILASMVYEVIFSNIQNINFEILPLMVGFLFSFLFGILAIKFMLKLIKKVNFIYFGIYLFSLSTILSFALIILNN